VAWQSPAITGEKTGDLKRAGRPLNRLDYNVHKGFHDGPAEILPGITTFKTSQCLAVYVSDSFIKPSLKKLQRNHTTPLGVAFRS
jgi:hypothetical protein